MMRERERRKKREREREEEQQTKERDSPGRARRQAGGRDKGQVLKWVRPMQLRDYPMPPADVPLVAMLRDLL